MMVYVEMENGWCDKFILLDQMDVVFCEVMMVFVVYVVLNWKYNNVFG